MQLYMYYIYPGFQCVRPKQITRIGDNFFSFKLVFDWQKLNRFVSKEWWDMTDAIIELDVIDVYCALSFMAASRPAMDRFDSHGLTYVAYVCTANNSVQFKSQ